MRFLPCYYLILTHQGTAQVVYDSQEATLTANMVVLVHPEHLAKVVRAATGGIAPGKWIEQYVITQAKQLLEYQRAVSLKQIAYTLGFTEPTSFYRYFKHATGMTAKEYLRQLSLPGLVAT